jgi:hypothetical protein
MSDNPIHRLIDRLRAIIPAYQQCHEARTVEEHKAAVEVWRGVRPEVHFYDAAVGELANPAIALCVKRGQGSPENIALVESAATCAVQMAMLPADGQWSIYRPSDQAEARKISDAQRHLLLDGVAAVHCLKRLAALTGEEWSDGAPDASSEAGVATPKANGKKRPKKNPRGRFAYEQACKAPTLKTGLVAFNAEAKKKGWEPVTTTKGLTYIARKWAKENGKPPPPSRRDK